MSSVKPRRQHQVIRTVRDARKDQMIEDACRESALNGHPKVGILKRGGSTYFYAYTDKGKYTESVDARPVFQAIGEAE